MFCYSSYKISLKDKEDKTWSKIDLKCFVLLSVFRFFLYRHETIHLKLHKFTGTLTVELKFKTMLVESHLKL